MIRESDGYEEPVIRESDGYEEPVIHIDDGYEEPMVRNGGGNETYIGIPKMPAPPPPMPLELYQQYLKVNEQQIRSSIITRH